MEVVWPVKIRNPFWCGFNIRPVTVWVLLSAAYNKFTRPSDMKKMGTWTHEEDIGLRLSVGDMVFDGLVNGNHIWKWFDFVMLEGSKWVSKIIICILHWVSSHAWPMVDEIYWEIDRLDSSIVWRGDPLNWCQCTQHNICTQQCYNWIVVVRGFHPCSLCYWGLSRSRLKIGVLPRLSPDWNMCRCLLHNSYQVLYHQSCNLSYNFDDKNLCMKKLS